jgi:hypothetical protein
MKETAPTFVSTLCGSSMEADPVEINFQIADKTSNTQRRPAGFDTVHPVFLIDAFGHHILWSMN